MDLASLIMVIFLLLAICIIVGMATYFVIKEWQEYKEEKYQKHLLEGKKNLRKKLFPKSRMNDPIYDWPLLKAKDVKPMKVSKFRPSGMPKGMKFVYDGKTQELKNDHVL